MFKASKCFVVVCVLALTGSAFGEQFNGTISNDWADPCNWASGVVPTITTEIHGYAVANPTIASGTAAQAGFSPIGRGTTLIINGSYTSGGRMTVGFGEGTGTIDVNAGGVIHNEGQELYLCEGDGVTGVLNVSGTVYTGAVDIGVATAGSATINVLPGGSVVDTDRLTFNRNAAFAGTLALIISPGGSFSCVNGWNLQANIDNGRIRATPGAMLMKTDVKTGTQKVPDGNEGFVEKDIVETKFTAIPEPVSMLLLGLGSLCLYRRK
jgi:hypothetical protein